MRFSALAAAAAITGTASASFADLSFFQAMQSPFANSNKQSVNGGVVDSNQFPASTDSIIAMAGTTAEPTPTLQARHQNEKGNKEQKQNIEQQQIEAANFEFAERAVSEIVADIGGSIPASAKPVTTRVRTATLEDAASLSLDLQQMMDQFLQSTVVPGSNDAAAATPTGSETQSAVKGTPIYSIPPHLTRATINGFDVRLSNGDIIETITEVVYAKRAKRADPTTSANFTTDETAAGGIVGTPVYQIPSSLTVATIGGTTFGVSQGSIVSTYGAPVSTDSSSPVVTYAVGTPLYVIPSSLTVATIGGTTFGVSAGSIVSTYGSAQATATATPLVEPTASGKVGTPIYQIPSSLTIATIGGTTFGVSAGSIVSTYGSAQATAAPTATPTIAGVYSIPTSLSIATIGGTTFGVSDGSIVSTYGPAQATATATPQAELSGEVGTPIYQIPSSLTIATIGGTTFGVSAGSIISTYGSATPSASASARYSLGEPVYFIPSSLTVATIGGTTFGVSDGSIISTYGSATATPTPLVEPTASGEVGTPIYQIPSSLTIATIGGTTFGVSAGSIVSTYGSAQATATATPLVEPTASGEVGTPIYQIPSSLTIATIGGTTFGVSAGSIVSTYGSAQATATPTIAGVYSIPTSLSIATIGGTTFGVSNGSIVSTYGSATPTPEVEPTASGEVGTPIYQIPSSLTIATIGGTTFGVSAGSIVSTYGSAQATATATPLVEPTASGEVGTPIYQIPSSLTIATIGGTTFGVSAGSIVSTYGSATPSASASARYSLGEPVYFIPSSLTVATIGGTTFGVSDGSIISTYGSATQSSFVNPSQTLSIASASATSTNSNGAITPTIAPAFSIPTELTQATIGGTTFAVSDGSIISPIEANTQSVSLSSLAEQSAATATATSDGTTEVTRSAGFSEYSLSETESTSVFSTYALGPVVVAISSDGTYYPSTVEASSSTARTSLGPVVVQISSDGTLYPSVLTEPAATAEASSVSVRTSLGPAVAQISSDGTLYPTVLTEPAATGETSSVSARTSLGPAVAQISSDGTLYPTVLTEPAATAEASSISARTSLGPVVVQISSDGTLYPSVLTEPAATAEASSVSARTSLGPVVVQISSDGTLYPSVLTEPAATAEASSVSARTSLGPVVVQISSDGTLYPSVLTEPAATGETSSVSARTSLGPAVAQISSDGTLYPTVLTEPTTTTEAPSVSARTSLGPVVVQISSDGTLYPSVLSATSANDDSSLPPVTPATAITDVVSSGTFISPITIVPYVGTAATDVPSGVVPASVPSTVVTPVAPSSGFIESSNVNTPPSSNEVLPTDTLPLPSFEPVSVTYSSVEPVTASSVHFTILPIPTFSDGNEGIGSASFTNTIHPVSHHIPFGPGPVIEPSLMLSIPTEPIDTIGVSATATQFFSAAASETSILSGTGSGFIEASINHGATPSTSDSEFQASTGASATNSAASTVETSPVGPEIATVTVRASPEIHTVYITATPVAAEPVVVTVTKVAPKVVTKTVYASAGVNMNQNNVVSIEPVTVTVTAGSAEATVNAKRELTGSQESSFQANGAAANLELDAKHSYSFAESTTQRIQYRSAAIDVQASPIAIAV